MIVKINYKTTIKDKFTLGFKPSFVVLYFYAYNFQFKIEVTIQS